MYKIKTGNKVGESTRLAAKFVGLLIVLKSYDNQTYKIKSRKREMVVYHDLIKPCRANVPVWAEAIKARVQNGLPIELHNFEEVFELDAFWKWCSENKDSVKVIDKEASLPPVVPPGRGGGREEVMQTSEIFSRI